MQSQEVLEFWFNFLQPEQWWRVDADLDAAIRSRFTDLHAHATQGELFSWRSSAQGRLAEVIVLDQFSRNLHRGTAQAFAQDGMALVLAQEAIAGHVDRTIEEVKRRAFFYMPFMHSESLLIHDVALQLFAQPGLESQLDFEHRHRHIIERFGRYPHRNAILGRDSTPEEQVFLSAPDSSF